MTGSAAALQSKANPQQLEAILATDGPVLIIAGPGSGKTFTLVERIVYPKQIVPRNDDFPDVPTAVRLAATDAKDDTTNWHAEVLAFLNRLKESERLSDWNQVAFLFRSVKNDKVVALARFLEAEGVPVYSPRSNMFFEREEIRLMIGALIFLFPQFPKVRQWADGVTLDIWGYYDHHCFAAFANELRKPENKRLLDWARPLAKRHAVLAQNTDYAFSGLFYQLLQFPLFARFLSEDALQGVDTLPRDQAILVNLSGRGDKDMETVLAQTDATGGQS